MGCLAGKSFLGGLVLSCTVLLCMLAHVFQLTWGLKHWRSLHEESHQAFQVLSGGCEQELFAHVPQSAQPYAPEADALLEFRKQSLYLSSLPLRVGKGWSVDQVPGALPGGLMDMDGEMSQTVAKQTAT